MTTTRQIDPQSAVEEMWRIAPLLAKAKSERVYLEEYRKSLKSILMGKSMEKTESGRERDAYSHPDYIAHLGALRDAVEEEEKMRWRMIASQSSIEIWRSMESSNRMIDRGAR